MLIVGGTGLLTIVVDHVVLTARMPLLAAIGLIAVSLIPSIAVPGEVDVMAFVLLAAAILFLMRTDTRSREEPTDREADTNGRGARDRARDRRDRRRRRSGGGSDAPPAGRARRFGHDGLRPRDRRDPPAGRRPAATSRGRGPEAPQRCADGTLSARHDAVAARGQRLGTRQGAHGAARERARARRCGGGRGHPDQRVRHQRRGAQSRLAVAAGRLPRGRGERTAGTVGRRSVQPDRPHARPHRPRARTTRS